MNIISLSTREKIILLAVVVVIGFFIYDFFIKKSSTDIAKTGNSPVTLNNLLDFNNLLKDKAILGEGAQRLTNLDTYIINRAQSSWARDPFPEKSFFSKPLMTIQEAAREAATERERIALLRAKAEYEAAEAKRKEALFKADEEKKTAEEVVKKALLEEKRKAEIQSRAEKLNYSGYVYMGNYPIVIVKGMEYLKGDEVDGFIIKKIEPEMVTLQDKGNGDVIILPFEEETLWQKEKK